MVHVMWAKFFKAHTFVTTTIIQRACDKKVERFQTKKIDVHSVEQIGWQSEPDLTNLMYIQKQSIV